MECITALLVVYMTLVAMVTSERSKLILISMDGFRYDYTNKTSAIPHFKELLQAGVTVPFMNNSFITKTFPCHYTMATGLHPENHGIVANSMYDPEHNATFSLSSTESFWWDSGEPIWITLAKAGLKAGVYFWPGSEAIIQERRATEWRHFDQNIPFEQRVDTAVTWLVTYDFDFVMIYFNEPDTTGHKYGPDSSEVVKAIQQMDNILGYVMSKLKEHDLKDRVNLIVTSDHGMTAVNVENQTIDIPDLAGPLLSSMIDEGASTNLIPQPNKAKELVKALFNVDHLHVMLKEDIPERFHLKNNRRVMPVFAYADEGWLITANKTKLKERVDYKGAHGYDNTINNMKPFFIASGPDFKTGGQLVDPIQSVDIYPLICHLLGVPAAPNNGSLERVKTLLRHDVKIGVVNGGGNENCSNNSATYCSSLHTYIDLCLIVYFVKMFF